MPPVPRPRPCYLDEMERLGAYGGEQRWRRPDGERLYTWDSMHGEIEVYDRRGYHLGAADAVTGEMIKPARKGQRIDV
jgi:Cytotoxic